MSVTSGNRETGLLVSQLQQSVAGLEESVGFINGQIGQLQNTIQFTTTPQAVNQIYNGSITHSDYSWTPGSPANDCQYECHYWFAHPNIANQPMFLNTTLTGDATVAFTQTDVTAGPPSTIHHVGHGLGTGVAVNLTSATPVPPLVSGTTYFAIYVDADNFSLATTAANAEAGTSINLTGGAGAVANTLSFNYTLKEPTNALYSETFADWSWTEDGGDSAGTARFEGDTSIDTIIPGDNIQPGYTYYAVFNVVKKNQYIAAAGDERIWCGLYNKQGSTWDWVKGAFTVTAQVLNGTPSGGAIDYRILATTDRGFNVLSDVVSLATGPSNAEFIAGQRVYLSWSDVLVYGVQAYQIWRLRGGVYELLQTITTGLTSTLDNNATTGTTSGSWPSGDFTSLVSYNATIPNVLDSLPYSGDPLNPLWATIPLTLKVAQNYDMSTVDLPSKQWLRWGFTTVTGRLDLRVLDCSVSNGGFAVISTAGQFSSTDPDMTGLTILITSKGQADITTTISVVNSANQLTLPVSTPYDSDTATVYITHGAPAHAVWLDLAHLTYIQGAGFSPAAADIEGHGPPPVTPNGTTQGGSGGGQQGGGIDGQPVCLYEDEEVVSKDGIVLAKDLKTGMLLADGYGTFNTIREVKRGVSDVYLIETENGVTLKATATKQIFTPDGKKTLASLEKGDNIYTIVNDVLQPSRLLYKTLLLKNKLVVQIGLKPTESFLAGGGTGRVLVSNSKPILIGGELIIV